MNTGGITYATVSLPFIPPAALCGNALQRPSHIHAMKELRDAFRTAGRDYGSELLNNAHYGQIHQMDFVAVEIEVWLSERLNPRTGKLEPTHDADNIMAGYKYFFDGLEQSKFLHDDSQILSKSIRLYPGTVPRGEEVSRITFRRAAKNAATWPWEINLLPRDGGPIPDGS